MIRQWFQSADGHPGDSFERRWRGLVKRRIALTFGLLALWAAAVEARLVYLQVYEHKYYEQRASHQQQNEIELAAPRGDILDRTGTLLASSVAARAIMAIPKGVDDPAGTAAELCHALGDCAAGDRKTLADRLAGKGPFYVRRARDLTPEQAGRVDALALPGIHLESETVRYYPKLDSAAHLVGFVSADDKALGGIEYAFDGVIRGTPGKVLVQLDGGRHWMQTTISQPSTQGGTVELTIDLGLQHIVERELAAGVEQNHAHAGTAIVMDPSTGEILALANYPTFNPNAFNKYTDEERHNRAVQDVYEPGSTFKIVTASAALEGRVVAPDEIIDCNPGVITIPGREPITEASNRNHGLITFEDVIVQSSNVGAVKIGLRVGADRMFDYVKRFGFGQVLGSDFRGQSAGKVWSRASINDSALASMAMGYQVSVTPLQMATAISAVANGGLLLEPHVVRAVVRNGQRDAVAPVVIRRAITPETAATLTTFMEGVVQRGTATAANLDRYQVAGKTGTSHKAITGGYSQTDYNSSFVGFVPSRKPAFTILVVIDTPRAGKYFGGEVAAPIFKRIADAALATMGVPPTIRPVPPILVGAITADMPGATPQPARAMKAPVVTQAGGRAVMPDVRGLSMRDALRVLGAAGLTTELGGDGFVITQSPAPGSAIEPGGRSVLRLRRVPDGHGGGGRR